CACAPLVYALSLHDALPICSRNAAIVGGVVGAILALVLLAAVAFLAFKYAVAHGLLSRASKTVDMSAANSNPLYKSETTVKTNPDRKSTRLNSSHVKTSYAV